MKLPGHFVVYKQGHLRIISRDPVSQNQILSFLQEDGRGNKNIAKKIIKEGSKSTVYLLPVSLDEKGENTCVKHYRYQGWFYVLKSIFTPSRAISSLRTAVLFSLLEIKTAKTVAVVEKKRGLLLNESYLFMEDISRHLGLPEFIEENFTPPLSIDKVQQKRNFIKGFAKFLIMLHEKGIYQKDLKATNILVEKKSLGEGDFWLIDLDKVLFLKKVSRRRKIKNLCQINTSLPWQVTLTDRMRFFHHYTGKKYLGKEEKKTIKKIIKLSGERYLRWHPRFKMGAIRIRELQ